MPTAAGLREKRNHSEQKLKRGGNIGARALTILSRSASCFSNGIFENFVYIPMKTWDQTHQAIGRILTYCIQSWLRALLTMRALSPLWWES